MARCRFHFRFLAAAVVVPTLISVAAAEAVFEISQLQGRAKVQRAQKRTWEELSLGKKLHDNDIVESFFQTKLALSFGKGNIIILGSNSKLLLNIAEVESEGKTVSEVSITLFAGGAFCRAVNDAHVSIYTSNAVAETDSGAVSAVAEAKTGETGFQVLAGEVSTRNIAQIHGRTLTAGQTTMVFPGKEPTAPLYITYRHAAVLKHFFGDEYITSQLAAAGITPTEGRGGGGGQRSFSRSLMARKYGKAGDKEGIQKRPFSLNKIYGAILDDREDGPRGFYAPSKTTSRRFATKGEIGFFTSFALADGGVYPSLSLLPSYRVLPWLDIGLRLAVSRNHEEMGYYQVNSPAGYMDMLSHLDAGVGLGTGDDSVLVHAGRISDLTLGRGLVVNRFSNANPRVVCNPLGATTRARWRDFALKGFLADVAAPRVGGVHLFYSPSLYHFGAGYYFDFDQSRDPDYKDLWRFAPYEHEDDTIADSTVFHVHVYEINFAVDVPLTYASYLRISSDFAQKLRSGTDGFAARLPSFRVLRDPVEAGMSFVVESGRMFADNFHCFYPAVRRRLDTVGTVPQNYMLSSRRLHRSIEFMAQVNPLPRLGLDVRYLQGLSASRTYREQDSLESAIDFSYRIAVSAWDERVPKLHYAALHLTQIHGGTIPALGGFFASWGLKAGLDVESIPLFSGIAFDGGLSFYYLDLNGAGAGEPFNNRIDPGDWVIEVGGGARWGFL